MTTAGNPKRLLRGAITILTAGSLLTLGAGGIILYLNGKTAVVAGTAKYIFSRSIAASFLEPLLLPVIILAVLLIIAAVMKVQAKEAKPYLDKDTAEAMKRKESVSAYRGMKKRGYLFVFGVIAVLLTLSVTNGGIRDVLIKAISICTECIGLG